MSEPTFAALLASLRRSRRLSQSKLAKMAGYDHSFLSRIESGSREPSRVAVMALAHAMSLDPAERDRLLGSAGFAGLASPEPLSCRATRELDDLLRRSDPTRQEVIIELVYNVIALAKGAA